MIKIVNVLLRVDGENGDDILNPVRVCQFVETFSSVNTPLRCSLWANLRAI
jgi:hypothetical protein